MNPDENELYRSSEDNEKLPPHDHKKLENMSQESVTLPNPTILERLRSLFRDARNFQIFYLGIFLVYGIGYLGWDAEALKFTVIITTCLITQYIGLYFTTQNFKNLKSALITALGLCLLLKANEWQTLAFASAVAIGSKFLIRFNNKHLFNPANFGIILAVFLTGDAWISPGQWGNEAMLIYFIGAMGMIVLFKVGRIDTTIGFLGTFALLQYSYTCLYLGWPLDHFMHNMQSGTLLLFAFFMITDPVTTPNHRTSRIIWSVLVGIITFVMSTQLYVHTAPIWALFFITPLTVFLDKIFKAKKFSWYTGQKA